MTTDEARVRRIVEARHRTLFGDPATSFYDDFLPALVKNYGDREANQQRNAQEFVAREFIAMLDAAKEPTDG